MRRTFRQLAAVKPARYLEPGAPTGLTGLFTHPTPRSTLMYLYSATLSRLKEFPESSLYRQSTEALTQHRLSIVEAVQPAGLKEWIEKAAAIVKEHPEAFNKKEGPGEVEFEGGKYTKIVVNGREFVMTKPEPVRDDLEEEWDGEANLGPELEGTRTDAERSSQESIFDKRPGSDKKTVRLDPAPELNVQQIEELETKLGAGLIEEVIQVAEGELQLVDVMLKAKVWEDLEEKPVEGQWTYFSRDTGTGTTQAPPQK